MKGMFFFMGWFALAIFVSCNDYQTVLKMSVAEGHADKVKLAEMYYREKDYRRAVRLFEQVYSRYLGKPQGERVLYMYAHSEFALGGISSYSIAAELFRVFLDYYPNSIKRAEALFMKGKSNYMISPKYSVDQTDTEVALSALQEFIDTYPDDERLPEANKLVMELINKQERKAFEIAKNYGKIGYHKSCLTALQLFLIDFPGSLYREEAYFRILESSSELALNSVHSKVPERIKDAKKNYRILLKYFPNTSFKEASDEVLRGLEVFEEKFKKDKKII